VPDDLPPPVVPATPIDVDTLDATGRMEPVAPETEPELDPRELKALSRQERKEAKAALRREQQEARNAARLAKASAKAAAKLGAAGPAASVAAGAASDLAADEDVVDGLSADNDEPTSSDEADAAESADAPLSTDPRARAAQRVQRRLGKDADKLSAAEARARAREEARRRRAQAKEQKSGVVAEEAVVRPPEEPTEEDLAEDVSVVEYLTAQPIEAEPFAAETDVEQTTIAEPIVDEPVAEEPVVDEPAVDDVMEEPETDLPKPVVGQRIDEPAPVDVEESEPDPVVAWKPAVETREISKPVPVDGDAESTSRWSLAPVAGVVGLIALGISVLLAVGALLVALGFDSGGLYEGLRTVANLLVGPLEGAFDFTGTNAERKEHFLAWGAGSIGYLLISFVGQAVQRANDDE